MDGGRKKLIAELKKHVPAQIGENPMPEWVSQVLITALTRLVEELLTKLRTTRAHRKPKGQNGPESPVNI